MEYFCARQPIHNQGACGRGTPIWGMGAWVPESSLYIAAQELRGERKTPHYRLNTMVCMLGVTVCAYWVWVSSLYRAKLGFEVEVLFLFEEG